MATKKANYARIVHVCITRASFANRKPKTNADMLLKLWKANWDQARHVELQRAGFTTAFAAVFITAIIALNYISILNPRKNYKCISL